MGVYNSLVVAMMLMFVIATTGGVWAGGDCDADLNHLVTKCLPYVQKFGPKLPPSSKCCDSIKKAGETCICTHVTRKIENVISMEKAVYVADKCGVSIPSGTKCGSYTVPPN